MAPSFSPLTSAQRSLRARIAAHAQHAAGRTSTTAATAAFLERFERLADPDGTLDLLTRQRRAAHLRQQHMLALALKASRARKLAAALFTVATERGPLDEDPKATIAALARQELLDKALAAVDAVEAHDANPATATPWRTERGPVAPVFGPED